MVIVKAILIFFIGRWLIKVVLKQVKKILEKHSFDPMLTGFIESLLKFLLYFVLIMAILQTFGVETTSLIAILGAASLAIGLALQGNLANFASGVMLVTFKPFKVGDYVEVGGNSGNIVEIGIFQLIMKTLDNKQVIIPNSAVTGGVITNYNAYDERRVDLTIGVDYGASIDHVKKVIQDVVEAHDKVLADKPVFVRMAEMADSSLNFAVRVWTRSEYYWDVYFDLNENIKKKLDEEGISIPYPHLTIEMKK
ncbi:MAG: mechanosensitive ion channel [Syntrophomonadaceae bacterium]|nr:mechanosensitive ion channel [Syntrophomonadaceae bacterium]